MSDVKARIQSIAPHRAGKDFSKRHIATLLFGLGVLTVLFVFSGGVDPDVHNQAIRNIRSLKEQFPVVKQEVLKAGTGLSGNYDALAGSITSIRNALGQLKDGRFGIYGQAGEKTDKAIRAATELSEEMFLMIEDYKSDHAIYQNATTYFPLLAREVSQLAVWENEHSEIPNAAMQLRLAIAAFQLSTTVETRQELTDRIFRLSSLVKSAPPATVQHLRQLLRHGVAILHFGVELSTRLEALLALPVEKHVDDIFVTYGTYYRNKEKVAETYRAVLYLASLILFLYAGYVYVAIRRAARDLRLANETLEERVEERTADLRNNEKELEQTVEALEMRESRLEAQARELVAYTEDLDQIRRELEKLNTQKDNFFAIVAHDLRSPFNALLGFSQLLSASAETATPTKIAEYSNSIHSAANQAYKLLEDLLDWSRLQLDRIEFLPEDFNLSDLVDTCHQRYELVAAGKDIRVLNETPAGIHVMADINMVDTILRNLVSNALKFTPAGGTVAVTANEHDGRIFVSVRDTGVGIPPDRLNKLLELGETKSTTGTDGETGTGLGLQLCRELIDKHDGELTIESAPGSGSVFTFSLPGGANTVRAQKIA